jgi:hypothetical protein
MIDININQIWEVIFMRKHIAYIVPGDLISILALYPASLSGIYPDWQIEPSFRWMS